MLNWTMYMCPLHPTNTPAWRQSTIKFTSYLINGCVIDRKSTRLNSSHQLTLFPYTTLFRSHAQLDHVHVPTASDQHACLAAEHYQVHQLPDQWLRDRSEEHTSELQSPIDTLSLHDALPISCSIGPCTCAHCIRPTRLPGGRALSSSPVT